MIARLRSRWRLAVATLLAAVVVAACLLVALPGPSSVVITAEFAETPGLYAGNHVDVLGIPVGRVLSVKPGPGGVAVKMRVKASQPIPAGAKAVLMAPDVVNDRYVQLTPAYGGGPTLANGAVIPLSRTAIPISVDQVFGALDDLAKALGPKGANAHGALSTLLRRLATALGNNGSAIHDAIVEASGALAGIASSPTELASLLDNLGQLTQAAADHTVAYQHFAADLQAVSASLAADNTDIQKALGDLQTLFANLTSFVRTNQSSLGGSVANLQLFAKRLASGQKALAATIDVGPLALQNLDAAVDPAAPGGPALRGRFDPTTASDNLLSSVCGNTLLRGLTVATNAAQRTELDVDCLLASSLQALPAPPGASTGPTVGFGTLAGSTP